MFSVLLEPDRLHVDVLVLVTVHAGHRETDSTPVGRGFRQHRRDGREPFAQLHRVVGHLDRRVQQRAAESRRRFAGVGQAPKRAARHARALAADLLHALHHVYRAVRQVPAKAVQQVVLGVGQRVEVAQLIADEPTKQAQRTAGQLEQPRRRVDRARGPFVGLVSGRARQSLQGGPELLRPVVVFVVPVLRNIFYDRYIVGPLRRRLYFPCHRTPHDCFHRLLSSSRRPDLYNKGMHGKNEKTD